MCVLLQEGEAKDLVGPGRLLTLKSDIDALVEKIDKRIKSSERVFRFRYSAKIEVGDDGVAQHVLSEAKEEVQVSFGSQLQ